jgi:RNA polymerase sigma factor (sigma-70 family)
MIWVVEILRTREAGMGELWSERERRRVTRLCAVLTDDPSAAEDLAQETMREAWRIRHRLVDPSGQGPWLDAIARNVCHRWRVRRGRLASHELPSERPEGSEGSVRDGHDPLGDLLEKEELAELLERALRLLPADTRAALVARYVEELGLREIAGRLSTSPEAVSMRLVRGRARIRELLEGELAEEPLAQVWLSRHGSAWRATRLPCPTCGRQATSMRRDERASVLELRCDRCDPGGVASAWRLDNPQLRPHLTEVRRPSAVLARMALWSHRWWPAAISAGHAACTRCGRDVRVSTYVRSEQLDPRNGRGWHASCEACGEVLSTSLLGLLLAAPETRSLRSRRPDAHGIPTRRVERDGRPALLVGMYHRASGEGTDLVVDELTARPHGVVVTR